MNASLQWVGGLAVFDGAPLENLDMNPLISDGQIVTPSDLNPTKTYVWFIFLQIKGRQPFKGTTIYRYKLHKGLPQTDFV